MQRQTGQFGNCLSDHLTESGKLFEDLHLVLQGGTTKTNLFEGSLIITLMYRLKNYFNVQGGCMVKTLNNYSCLETIRLSE
jgi:hypothetical protein